MSTNIVSLSQSTYVHNTLHEGEKKKREKKKRERERERKRQLNPYK